MASVAFLAVPLARRADRAFRALPVLPDAAPSPTLPSLSIIVPARNEAHHLPALLASLKAMAYPGPTEILVVDDHSTDGTGDIAAETGARVVRPPDLPPGILGKPHACHHGALAASGDWLLFTDADTRHAPDGPAHAVAYALAHHLDGLSLFPRQEYRGLLDRLALMAAFAALFAGHEAGQPLLNGQYILLRREVYTASGGFAQVWREPLEDLALGHYLDSLSYGVPLLNGEHAASVQMYQNVGHLWHGMTRLGSGSLRWTSHLFSTVLFITAVMTPLLVGLGVARKRLSPAWLLATWATVALSLLPWARRFGGLAYAPLAPLGALVVQATGCWGLLRRFFGRGIRWKDRRV